MPLDHFFGYVSKESSQALDNAGHYKRGGIPTYNKSCYPPYIHFLGYLRELLNMNTYVSTYVNKQ